MTVPDRLVEALADRYRLERELGQGGMATVYLAEDLKHKRKVALKVLKPELAAVLGAERFVQEITTTAALQHPHILPLFDSGTAEGFLFYVMPFIDGETLRSKLNRETQLGVEEAVRITVAVADALEHAHRHGVIHRDIKPENILLHEGRPMVADFGIALAVSAAAGGRMTETGLSLGTPHYMSPEQATAEKEISARSDVYSLASVLYEMLAGQPPHLGGSAQQIIMKIVTDTARPLTELRKSVPPHVAAACATALEKLPADRFESAKAFADALANPAFGAGTGLVGMAPAAASRASRRLTGALGAVAGVALLVAAWGWLRPVPAPPVIRYLLSLPPEQAPFLNHTVPVPSPDGSFLLFHGPVEGRPGYQLWIKHRDRPTATPIPGTVDAGTFAISPDGQWIAFDAVGELRKVPVAGGAAIPLAGGTTQRVVTGSGVAWLEDDMIAFSAGVRGTPVLATVAASGGDMVLAFPDDSVGSGLPTPVWGTRNLLYARCSGPLQCDLWGWDRGAGRTRLVVGGVTYAAHAPTGHLVYLQADRLMVVPFDAEALEVRGTPVAVADSIGLDAPGRPLALSRAGTLVVGVGGGGAIRPLEMVWVTRTGQVTPVDTSWRFQLTTQANNHGWELSPDGTRLAIGLATEAGDDIWVKQLPTGPLVRVSFDPAPDMRPRWTPDGRSLTFISNRQNGQVLQRRADGTGADSVLHRGIVDEARWAPDGSVLLLRRGALGSVAGGRDILAVRPGADTTPVPVLTTPADEEAPALSPDGRLMAYQSDETGRTEVFLRPFPDVDGFKQQVSGSGGEAPLWSRDGRELFYLDGAKRMVAVRVTPGAPPVLGEPTVLFQVPEAMLVAETAFYTPWDVARDGRFIMVRRAALRSTPSARLVVTEHWLQELTARVPR